MPKEYEPKYFEPEQVVTQIRTFAWMLGHLPGESITEDEAFGLRMLGDMIANNALALTRKIRSDTFKDTKSGN